MDQVHGSEFMGRATEQAAGTMLVKDIKPGTGYSNPDGYLKRQRHAVSSGLTPINFSRGAFGRVTETTGRARVLVKAQSIPGQFVSVPNL